MASLWRPVPTKTLLRPCPAGWGIRLYGSSSGSVGLKPAANAGSTDYTLPASLPVANGVLSSNSSGVMSWLAAVSLALGGTGVDLSSTGGTSQVLKQTSAGATITVGQLAASDLSNGVVGTGAVALQSYVDTSVTGLLDLKTATDCSANPNYPSALKGDSYYVSVAGKIGGASGTDVDAGDVFFAVADNAGGTQASVGSSWKVIEHNLPTLKTAAFVDTGTSGATIPLLNGANTWSAAQVIQQDNITTTLSAGLTLANTTAATSGVAVQSPPSLLLNGTQWNGGASIVDSWKLATQQTGGGSTSQISFGRSTNGGAYSTIWNMTSGGNVSMIGSLSGVTTITASGNISVGSGSSLLFTSSSRMRAFSNGNITFDNNAGTGLTSLVLGSDSASPIATTISVGSATGVSNTAGVNTTIIGSLSTGSGTSGDIVFKVGIKPGAGSPTVQATAATAFTIKGETLQLNCNGAIVTSGAITMGAGGKLNSATDGIIQITNTASSAGIALNAATDATLKIRNRANSADAAITAGSATFSGDVSVPTKTPSSAGATASQAGIVAWDSSYIYVSTGVNTWKRVAIATW